MTIDPRIASLPRREWTDLATPELVRRVSEWCRVPGVPPTGELRPFQAVGLLELRYVGGLFCVGRVGVGKTLLGGLAPNALEVPAERPLVLVPGNGGGLKKTWAELKEYRRQGWNVPIDRLTVKTYQWLGRREQSEYLTEVLKPDLGVCDEAEWLKNARLDRNDRKTPAAVALAIADCVVKIPSCRWVFLSASYSSDGEILDFLHLIAWALRERSPVPVYASEQLQWSAALAGTGDPSYVLGARDAADAEVKFQDRIRTAPGVLITTDRFDAVPIRFDALRLDTPPTLEDHWRNLRDFGKAPDGYVLGDRFQTYHVARQFARGYYTAKVLADGTRPPAEYVMGRQDWAGVVRRGVEAGWWRSEGHARMLVPDDPTLLEWDRLQAKYPTHTRFEWLDLGVAEWCAQWARANVGIVWVHGREFGAEVARRAGVPYYGAGGNGSVMRETGERSIVASIGAIARGYNLQGPRGVRPHFHRGLVTHWPAGGATCEQLPGRIHREEQTLPCDLTYLVSCAEDAAAVYASRDAADRLEKRTGQPQKVCYGAFMLPPTGNPASAAWRTHAVEVGEDDFE